MFNIFDELSWPQFIKINGIDKMPLNEQVSAYNQYLSDLNVARQNWIDYQNKGPLSGTTPPSSFTSTIEILVSNPGDSYTFTIYANISDSGVVIDYGDGETYETNTVFPSTVFGHNYTSAGTYTVGLTFTNPENITRVISDQND